MKSFEVVQSDMFDKRDLATMVEAAPKLRGSLAAIEDATPTGGDLGTDLWSSLIRFTPRKRDGVPPSHRVNETIIDRVWQADQYRDLKEYTVGDPVNTAAGVNALTRQVTGMLGELGDVAEQAQKAQEAQDALEDAMTGGGEGGLEGDIEDLRSQAAAESELLDEMLDEQLPRIDSAVRSGLEEAAADAGEEAAVAAGWDLEPGTAAAMDPAQRIRLMQRLRHDDMRRLADLMGAMHNQALGQRDRRYELKPGEVTGVTLGGNLSRLIPAEIASLGVPELEDLMILRAVKQRARVYLTRSVERAGRGAVIYLEDQSGSMDGARGDWSKAFGLTLLRVAREQDRAFHAFCFKGAGSWQRFDFPNPRAAVTEDMLAFASTVPDGGTEITGPMDEAVALLEAEYVKGGNTEGDIVLATDGEVRLPADWLAGFLADRDRLEFSVYGLAIQARIATLNALCTHVADVTDLTSGRDVADVFAAVN